MNQSAKGSSRILCARITRVVGRAQPKACASYRLARRIDGAHKGSERPCGGFSNQGDMPDSGRNANDNCSQSSIPFLANLSGGRLSFTHSVEKGSKSAKRGCDGCPDTRDGSKEREDAIYDGSYAIPYRADLACARGCSDIHAPSSGRSRRRPAICAQRLHELLVRATKPAR